MSFTHVECDLCHNWYTWKMEEPGWTNYEGFFYCINCLEKIVKEIKEKLADD